MHYQSILATKLLDSKGDFEKVRIAINGVLPSSIGDWWCITMDKREMIKFKGHQLQPLCVDEQVVVPHFKGLVKNYRASFPMLEPQLTKVILVLFCTIYKTNLASQSSYQKTGS